MAPGERFRSWRCKTSSTPFTFSPEGPTFSLPCSEPGASLLLRGAQERPKVDLGSLRPKDAEDEPLQGKRLRSREQAVISLLL